MVLLWHFISIQCPVEILECHWYNMCLHITQHTHGRTTDWRCFIRILLLVLVTLISVLSLMFNFIKEQTGQVSSYVLPSKYTWVISGHHYSANNWTPGLSRLEVCGEEWWSMMNRCKKLVIKQNGTQGEIHEPIWNKETKEPIQTRQRTGHANLSVTYSTVKLL